MSDEKQIVNTLYHAGVQTVLVIRYAEIGKKVFKIRQTKVDLNLKDVGMLTAEVLLAMVTKDMLVKQGIIPANIMK